jgi:hypothetical protein
MNEKNDFALVPRPPGAIEKAEPGARRILSGMVSDMLALVQKQPPAKRVFRVLTCSGEKCLNEAWQLMIEYYLGSGFVVEVTDCWKALEIVDLVKQRSFDLIVPLMNNVFTGAMDAKSHVAEGVELFARLKAQYGIPIIVCCTDLREMPGWADLPDSAKQAGMDAFFWTPFLFEQFRSALEACGLHPDSTEPRA